MPGCVQTLEYEAFLGRWRYSSAPPAPELVGVVLEYREVEGRLSPFRERILPNGATEVMINLGPPHTLLTLEGSSVWDSCCFQGSTPRPAESSRSAAPIWYRRAYIHWAHSGYSAPWCPGA